MCNLSQSPIIPKHHDTLKTLIKLFDSIHVIHKIYNSVNTRSNVTALFHNDDARINKQQQKTNTLSSWAITLPKSEGHRAADCSCSREGFQAPSRSNILWFHKSLLSYLSNTKSSMRVNSEIKAWLYKRLAFLECRISYIICQAQYKIKTWAFHSTIKNNFKTGTIEH